MASSDWPNLQDYAFSLQTPHSFLRDKQLRGAKIKCDGNGMPRGAAGNFAVVYKATLADGSMRAIRAFTSNRPEMTERYKKIGKYLETLNIDPIVNFTYEKKGIKAVCGGNMKSYPLVTMDWVEGEELYHWVAQRCTNGEKKKLNSAAERWFDLNQHLTNAKIAHGDLQHANVMVTRADELKLVDYDCMCVPDLVGEITLEMGVDPYQHPDRNGDTRLSSELDNFSAIFIFVVLRALAAEPRLWVDFVERVQYDKLLIRPEDFKNPSGSQLYTALRRSSDGEVGRMAKELFELYRADIDSVPRLEHLLFSYDRVRSAISQRDFDLAVQMVDQRHGGNGKETPNDLVLPLKNARERVRCLQQLERFVEAGDEAGMHRTYDPRLLDGYPKAQAAAAIAKNAGDVFQVLQLLRACEQKQKWRDAVQTWDGNQHLLRGRKSAQAWKGKIDGFRERNQLSADVLRISKQSKPDVAKLEQCWRQLQRKGGHPEIDPQTGAEIERVIVRERAWASFEASVQDANVGNKNATPSEQSDRALKNAWNESAFKGWAKAERHRNSYVQAIRRLDVVDRIKKQDSSTSRVTGEKSIVALGDELMKLHPGYVHPLAQRITLARKRTAHYEKLMSALACQPVSDLRLVQAFLELQQVQGEAMLETPVQTRIQLAVRRVPLIQQLRQIPEGLPANQYDEKIRNCWQNDLLAECHDAKPWLPRYQLAVRRKQLLAKLSAAIDANRVPEIVRLTKTPELTKYPYPQHVQTRVAQAVRDVIIVENMIEALKGRNRDQIQEMFDVRSFQQFEDLFAPHLDELIRWAKEALLTPEKLGLKAETGTKPIVPHGDGRACFLRWSFPKPRYSDTCWVTISKAEPRCNSDPVKIKPVFKHPVTRRNYERAGGYRIMPESKWKKYYVAVWAVIDLTKSAGQRSSPIDEEVPRRLISAPFVLGRLEKW